MSPRGSSIRLDNVYIDNNEQVSLVFFIAHAELNLIKLELYSNWSEQPVNNILECAMWNSSKPTKFLIYKP